VFDLVMPNDSIKFLQPHQSKVFHQRHQSYQHFPQAAKLQQLGIYQRLAFATSNIHILVMLINSKNDKQQTTHNSNKS